MPRRMPIALICVVLLAASTALASETRRDTPMVAQDAAGGGFEIPADWAGIWMYQNQTKDCVTGAITNTSSYSDTICAGDVILPGSGFYECTGGYDGSSYTAECVASQIIFEGCRADYRLVQTGTRNGNTFEQTARSTTTFVGEACGPLPNQCFDFVTTGTRIAPAPNPCSVPVDPISWSSLKSLHR